MHQLSTYILLLAIASTQLFGSTAMWTLRCADAGCQCSTHSKSKGSCCCSGRSPHEAKPCCASEAASCCDKESGLQYETPGSPTVCRCGCEDSSQPIPAQSESSSKELIRLHRRASMAGFCAGAAHARATVSPARSCFFYSGLSAQSLYCCWVI